MNRKILAIDLDGTLLSSRSKITKENLDALKAWTKSGNEIAILSGRSFITGNKIKAKIEAHTSKKITNYGFFNGAYVQTNNQITKSVIPFSEVKQLVNVAKKYDCPCWIYPSKEEYKNSIFVQSFKFKFIFGLINSIKMRNFTNQETDAYKFIFLSLNKNVISQIYSYLKKKFDKMFDVSLTSKFLIEVTRKNTNKGSALNNILKNKNYSLVAAIGDSNNDLPMLMNADISAVIKPDNKALEAAAQIKFTKQKNAVAKFINDYINNKDFYFNKEIKAIFCDLDGTLLNGKPSIVDLRTKVMIQEAAKYNIPFIITTGRSMSDSKWLYRYLELPHCSHSFIISDNGGVIYDANNDKYLKVNSINPKIVKQVYSIIKDYVDKNQSDAVVCLHDLTNELHVNSIDAIENIIKKRVNKTLKEHYWSIKKYREIKELSEISPVVKMIAQFTNQNECQKLIKILKSKKLPIAITASAGTNVEINALGIDKASGVKYVANLVNWSAKNIMTLGDSDNDISMLKYAKYGITYKKALPNAVKAAKHLFDSKSCDVVYDAISGFIFGKEKLKK